MLPTTHCIVPLMMNGRAARSQNEFLLRPHEHHAFTSFLERFITVIKVLFPDILPLNSPVASLPGTFDGHCEWVGFPFLSRWTSPAWIINSNRLCSEKQIASFKHENDWAKGWQTQQNAFIKAVYMRPKSQLLDPLEKWLCCAYNSSLTCCIYWKTNLSHGRPDWFSVSVISGGPDLMLAGFARLAKRSACQIWSSSMERDSHLECLRCSCADRWRMWTWRQTAGVGHRRSPNNLPCMKSCKSTIPPPQAPRSEQNTWYLPQDQPSGSVQTRAW